MKIHLFLDWVKPSMFQDPRNNSDCSPCSATATSTELAAGGKKFKIEGNFKVKKLRLVTPAVSLQRKAFKLMKEQLES